MTKIKKAVFPVAGLGTRFLPATKANPKEMLPIVDKPLIQYAVEEAVGAGIEQMIFVTSSSKQAIEDHFDKNYELEAELAKKGKKELLSIVQSVVPSGVSCIYVRQPDALGLGHAVLCAQPIVGNEPFAVILADDLIDGDGSSCLSQMAEVFLAHNNSVLGIEEVPAQDTDQYGVIAAEPLQDKLHRITGIVEKPAPEVAPSNLAVVGRYILVPRIFELLAQTSAGAGGEIQLTDAIARLLDEQQVLAYQFKGRRYDCGNKLGYLMATVEYALKHPALGAQFAQYIERRFGPGSSSASGFG